MTHSHNHAHHHDHHHIPKDMHILRLAFIVIFVFMIIEFIGGYFFNSLTLMADAGHMANDAFSLGLAWLALFLASRTNRVAKWLAVINGLSLILLSFWIIVEAIHRLQTPSPMMALPMIAVAFRVSR